MPSPEPAEPATPRTSETQLPTTRQLPPNEAAADAAGDHSNYTAEANTSSGATFPTTTPTIQTLPSAADGHRHSLILILICTIALLVLCL